MLTVGRLLASRFATASTAGKIKVVNPVVEMDGD